MFNYILLIERIMLIFISLNHNAEFDEGKVFVKLKLMDIEEQDINEDELQGIIRTAKQIKEMFRKENRKENY